MSNDSLHERGQALENMFFRERDQKLLDKMKSELDAEKARTVLAATTGITDESVLDHLIAQKITPETIAAVGLIPLVAVAWADGRMEENERFAILQATEQAGISREQASYELISSWLVHRPQDDLLETWKEYIGGLKSILEAGSLKQLKKSVMDRARTVADAAGGFMGLGVRISAAEQKILDEMAAAFD